MLQNILILKMSLNNLLIFLMFTSLLCLQFISIKLKLNTTAYYHGLDFLSIFVISKVSCKIL